MYDKKEAATQIWCWHHKRTGNFNDGLFTLAMKADMINRDRLRRAFPDLMGAFDEWIESNTPDDFYERYGLPTHGRRE